MAAASVSESLFALVSEEDRQQIPDTLSQKLEELWETKAKEITALKIDNEKLKITGDQEKFQLERELVAIRSQLEEESRLKNEAKSRSEELEGRLNQSDAEVQKAKATINSLSREVQHSHSEQENASTQSAAMAGSLESRTKRILELQEQVEKLEEQLTVLTRAKCEAVIRAEEACSRELHLQYKEKRLEQERSLLTRQVDRLQQQLEQRVEESVSQRREHSTTILRLQTDLNHKLEELRVEKEENERMQKGLDEKSQRIEELLAALNESRKSEMKLDETYRQELVAQKKLADIFQGSCQDEKERCAELEKAVEELRKLLQEASEQYGCLERAKKKAGEESAEALQQSNVLVKELKEELDRVNLLMEASAKKDLGGLEDLSPAASAASHLVSRGLSLTQLYSEYMTVSEKLIATEEENKRLKRYVDQMLQEIEDRVPIFKKQRDDHQRSLETITSLHSQLEETLQDLEKQRIEADEARRRTKYLERENGRLGLEVKDLGKQVTVLVMQVEAARAGQPPPAIPMDTENPTEAGEVISQRLVAFRNVTELQEQNTNLRTSLRELSQQMESIEKEAVENRTQDLQEELDTAKAQLTELQSARERQESLMENIVNQRNMYRTLLSQQSPTGMSKPQPKAQASQPAETTPEEVQKVKEELESAKKEIASMKKEYDEYREEKLKNDKLIQEEYENLRANMEKTRNENIKLVSQAEYNDERIKTQQNNAEVLQRQIMALEKNNSTLQGIIGRHESTIEALRNELLNLQKKLSCAEVALENLKEERMLLKESEARLLSERDSFDRAQSSQAMVLANLETIKINLERSDATKNMRYENQIAELTEQCSRLKAKLESNIEVKEATMKLNEAENRIRNMHQEHAATTKQLLEVKAELSATKARLTEAQDKTKTMPSPQGNRARGGSPVASSPFRLAGSSPQVRDLQVQLTEERATNSSLQASLDQSKKSNEELLGIVKQHEKQLAESNDACKAVQEQLKKLQEEKKEVEEKLAKSEKQLSEAVEEGEAVKSLLQTQLAKMQDELQAAQKKLKDATEGLAAAKEEESKAKKDAEQKAQLAGEVQDKYEREVMLHGADLKALAALKEKQAEYNSELQQVTMAKLKAEEAVRDTRLGFEERENMLRRENKDLLMRSHELEEQNKALLDQFTQLSDRMAALQTKLTVPGSESANASFTEDEARSSDQLREVIKYLRRERDVAAGKSEVAQAEVERLTAQKKILESQIEQLSKNLSEEREKSQASLDTAGRYGELLRKVHTMDALADSNRLLREEKEGLQTTITEFKAKFESLEKQIEPLQEKQRISDNKIESLVLEKRSIENEKDLYKKRTHELVEKLNRAKPEDFIKLQQEVVEQQKTLQSRENEVTRLKNQLAQLSKNQHMIVNQKNQALQQLSSVRAEFQKATEELKRLTAEKTRIQNQSSEEVKKITLEKARLQQQLVGTQERVRSLESSSQQAQSTHQQEMSKMQEQRNREQHQERQQLADLKQREDALKNQLELTKKEAESLAEKLKEAEGKYAEAAKKADNFEKQSLQLRKIATKYKKAAEGGSAAAASTTGEGEEPASGTAAVSAEKVKEYEDTIANLQQKQEKTQEEANKLQQELSTLKQTLSSKEAEVNAHKSQDSEVTKLRSDLDNKTRELQIAQNVATQLKQNVTKQIADVTKRLEESQNKKQMYENRISQLEKERDHLSREVEMVNKKLQIQQRQFETLQKQVAGTSKPSTSGVTSDKTGFEPPPTANIKPMSAPVATSASPRSQTATQVVPPSRAIPTASIRPMAPPSGGSAPAQGSTVVVVSPLETHSDGMVSSTVTLPQATVTPTPAISAPTLLTTATTTPAATTMTSTLTATVSPTPASASLTTPVAPAVALPSTPSSQSSQASTSQSTLASQSSSVSQSSANVESTPASQSTSAAQSIQSAKPSGHLQTAAAASSSAAAQSTLASQSSSSGGQLATASTSIVVPIVSAVPAAPAQHGRQDSQEVSADALVSQAIALVSPLSSQEVAGPSSAGSKRKLEPSEAALKDPKRVCVDDDEAGPSSSHGGQENDEDDPEVHDTVVVDSDGEEHDQDYIDHGEGDEDEDEDEDEEEEDDEPIEDEEQIDDDEEITVIDDNDEEMERDEGSRGFNVASNQESREANEDVRNADAEAEAASGSSAHVEESNSESPDAPSESQRPQPSGGSSQPSSSGQNEGPSQTGQGMPLVLPRPVVRQERPVGRQNLAPFSQLPHYEEGGDDSIVPSTPTLFVPRRGDGFSEAVSSPQVPSGGFVFGSNAEVPNPSQTSGLAQMAEGGLIDDTRIDLGLDEGNRSQPTTPLRRSPTAELGAEGGVSTSEGESTHEPPAPVVTGGEQSNDETSRDDNFTEADSMAVDIGDDDNEVEEGEEEEEDEDVEEEGGDQDEVIDVDGDDDGNDGEENQGGEGEREGSGEIDQPSADVSSAPSSTPSSISNPARRITPITWNSSPQRMRADRGQRFMSMPGGRGMMRGRGFPPNMRGGPLMRGQQRARRSRPGSFPRGGM